MTTHPKTVIIHGPMKCGKTRNRAALAAHFDVSVIVDDWQPRHDKIIVGALHLTNESVAPVSKDPLAPFVEIHDFHSIQFDPARDNGARRIDRMPKRFGA